MTITSFVSTTELRARFARALAALYGSEVPAYKTLVEVATEVNEAVVSARGAAAERLGDINRVTAERHGAIRVGSPFELAQVARVFAAFGMHPVGFYDLRESGGKGVPVVSTAFRPVDEAELAANPFRVFTSMLTARDPRFFDKETQTRLQRFIGDRELFSPELLGLADRSAFAQGLDGVAADRLVMLATETFRLSREPIVRAWHARLSAISSVAADIAGQPSTHINHLTPRVLDIAELYRRMQARGIEMIDAIQGPPAWSGPDLLLRQTSFRALAEPRRFITADGRVEVGELRVRFGEVEQRGIALTVTGLGLYEQAALELERQADGADQDRRQELNRAIWDATFPVTERGLASARIAWCAVRATGTPPANGVRALSELVDAGVLELEPIVYEDFLPRSAAGIFRSNLTTEGSRNDEIAGTEYDIDKLSAVVGMTINDPQTLYREQRARSVVTASAALGVEIDDDELARPEP
jgi:uncharacterized glyoxalase superfamily metalloenzyme YdcJ